MVKIKIDADKCVGCGSCAAVSQTFEIRDGKAVLKNMPAKITNEKEAANSCPVGAIEVSD